MGLIRQLVLLGEHVAPIIVVLINGRVVIVTGGVRAPSPPPSSSVVATVPIPVVKEGGGFVVVRNVPVHAGVVDTTRSRSGPAPRSRSRPARQRLLDGDFSPPPRSPVAALVDIIVIIVAQSLAVPLGLPHQEYQPAVHLLPSSRLPLEPLLVFHNTFHLLPIAVPNNPCHPTGESTHFRLECRALSHPTRR